MKRTYLNSAACISAQPTLEEGFLEKLTPILEEQELTAIPATYRDYIPANLIRRMSQSVKMSSVAAEIALKGAGIEKPDAIIVGTGMGCEQDSEKFLRAVIENEEEYLTPTYFIQSTHNTVAGQIALQKECHGYNFTYVNAGSSLEMALLDAKLQLEENEATHVLVGATDEKSKRSMELYRLVGKIKDKESFPIDYLNSKTDGVAWGEGSAFFSLSKTPNSMSDIILKDVFFQNECDIADVSSLIVDFLHKNNMQAHEVDVLILGFSGDAKTDAYYKEVLRVFTDSQSVYFKHLSGEYNTSSGFALFMAMEILKQQRIPEVMKIQKKNSQSIKNILIYNHFFGKDHAYTLLCKE